jgi:membrane fusion protein, multidrug efflux system
VPLTALVFGAHGMQVATVDGNNRVALKRVRLGRNFGNLVEIESGISLTDRLVDNPPESTETGELVQVDGKAPTVAVAGKPSASSAKAD